MRCVGRAYVVSPELRAPFPAALCHGACGSERRQRLTGADFTAPAPLLTRK